MTVSQHDLHTQHDLHNGDLDRNGTGSGRGPEEGLAEAIGDLTDQTRALVQSEVAAARSEMWDKARASAPPLALVGVSAALGLGAAASGYRWTMRFLEKMMPPAAAAAFGTAFYGAGALLAAFVAAERLHDIRSPAPTRAVQATTEAVGRVAHTVRRTETAAS